VRPCFLWSDKGCGSVISPRPSLPVYIDAHVPVFTFASRRAPAIRGDVSGGRVVDRHALGGPQRARVRSSIRTTTGYQANSASTINPVSRRALSSARGTGSAIGGALASEMPCETPCRDSSSVAAALDDSPAVAAADILRWQTSPLVRNAGTGTGAAYSARRTAASAAVVAGGADGAGMLSPFSSGDELVWRNNDALRRRSGSSARRARRTRDAEAGRGVSASANRRPAMDDPSSLREGGVSNPLRQRLEGATEGLLTASSVAAGQCAAGGSGGTPASMRGTPDEFQWKDSPLPSSRSAASGQQGYSATGSPSRPSGSAAQIAVVQRAAAASGAGSGAESDPR
jgi:hypothetical protein